MPDREKVIKGLECCTKKVCIYKDTEKECPYCELCGEYEDAFEDCTTALAKDAIALLRAQEQRHRLEVHNIGNIDVPEGVTWEQFQAVMSGVVKALEHTDRGESWPYNEGGGEVG
jgi:hypothetical protein